MNMECEYLRLLRDILNYGDKRGDRTGTGTRSLFGPQIQCDLTNRITNLIQFPLLTTKRISFRLIVEELLWMLRGDTNVRTLQAKNVHIWDEWADEATGDLGPVYGHQWRHWGGSRTDVGFDQINWLIQRIKSHPEDRRLIVSAWNVEEIDDMKLPPCHCFFQCYVRNEFLDLKLYQRSADMFLGVPFNIASYALLTCMLAKMTRLIPGRFIHSFGDAHIYNNHQEVVDIQLSRMPFPLPQLVIHRTPERIEDFQYEDFELVDYECHSPLKAEVSV